MPGSASSRTSARGVFRRGSSRYRVPRRVARRLILSKTPPILIDLVRVTETGVAQSFSVTKTVSLTPTTESGSAKTLSLVKSFGLVSVTEIGRAHV